MKELTIGLNDLDTRNRVNVNTISKFIADVDLVRRAKEYNEDYIEVEERNRLRNMFKTILEKLAIHAEEIKLYYLYRMNNRVMRLFL